MAGLLADAAALADLIAVGPVAPLAAGPADTIRPHPEGHEMPRTFRTAKQRAEVARDLAQRAHDRARAVEKDARKALAAAEAAALETGRRLEHRKADPDLREDPQLPIEPAVAKGK